MSAVYLLPTLRQEKSVPEEIFSDTPKQIHYLSYTLSHFTNPNRTLFIPNPSGALLRRKRNAKGNAASGRIGECRGVRLGSATLTFMSEAPPATRRFPNLEPLKIIQRFQIGGNAGGLILSRGNARRIWTARGVRCVCIGWRNWGCQWGWAGGLSARCG